MFHGDALIVEVAHSSANKVMHSVVLKTYILA